MPALSTRSAQHLVSAAALLLIAASASLGAYYGYIIGSQLHVLTGLIFAAAALGGELLKPFAVSAALEAFGRWQVLRGLACAVLASICIVYSITSELGLAAGSRSDLVASRRALLENNASTKQDRDRAEAELATLAPARDGLQGRITALKATPGANGCLNLDGPVSRRVCSEAAELEEEAARAKRRAKLEAVIRK